MSNAVVTGDGRHVKLGALIKSGGAGSVYHLHDDVLRVAKIYHPNADHAQYARRIAAMLELTPDLPDLAVDGERYVQLAWPQAAIYDEGKRFLGYLMPAVDVDATSELECILQERQARSMGLPTGLGAKVTLAANLCAVIAALHRQRHCIVDLKPVNLRFYPRSLYMAMLDCDGFSIQGHGERFHAPQYTPDYLAPEFHARGLTEAGEQQQDRFALAVVVFQLLNFGIHPFTGRPQHDRVPTDIPNRIAGRWYAYGIRPNASLRPSPTSGHAAMPLELRLLFDRAFESAGSTRPAADEWSALLRGYAQRAEGKLLPCRRDKAHQQFAGHACAACARQDLLAGAMAAARARPPRDPAGHARSTTRVPVAGRRPSPTPPSRGQGAVPPPSPPPRPAANAPGAASARAAAIIAAQARRAAASRKSPNAPLTWSSSSASPWSLIFSMGWLACIFLFVVVPQCMDDRNAYDTELSGYAQRRSPEERVRLDAELRAQTYQDPAEAEALDQARPNPQAQAQADTSAQTVVAPTPNDAQLGTFTAQIDHLLDDVQGRDGSSMVRSLERLRTNARDRELRWQRNIAGGPPRSPDEFDAVRLKGASDRDVGWAMLRQRDGVEAQRYFLLALWADPTDAEAWFGYGAAQGTRDTASAAIAMGVLHFPDVAQARALRADAEPMLYARGLPRAEVDDIFEKAAASANALRYAMPHGQGRRDEFAWR